MSARRAEKSVDKKEDKKELKKAMKTQRAALKGAEAKRAQTPVTPFAMSSCFLSGAFSTALFIWSLIWIFLILFNMEIAVKAILSNLSTFVVCTVMPVVGMVIVELRYKISSQPSFTATQRAAMMIGRLIGGLAIVYITKRIWLSALEPTVVTAAVEAVVNATDICVEKVVEVAADTVKEL